MAILRYRRIIPSAFRVFRRHLIRGGEKRRKIADADTAIELVPELFGKNISRLKTVFGGVNNWIAPQKAK